MQRQPLSLEVGGAAAAAARSRAGVTGAMVEAASSSGQQRYGS